MSPARPPGTGALEELLRRAAADEGLRRDLLERRDEAAVAAGVWLGPRERAVLQAVPAVQLVEMIAAVGASAAGLERREFLREAGSAAVVLLGGAALGGAALGPGVAHATPPGPPAGIRPDLPWFEGELDVVRYRVLKGPARPLPDVEIERRLLQDGVRRVPPQLEGTLRLRVELDSAGRVTQVTAAATRLVTPAALADLCQALRRVRFRAAVARTVFSFDLVFARRRRGAATPWSGRVELVDVDTAGGGAAAVRRVVQGLAPRFRERLAAAQPPQRPAAGKLRYAFRTDAEGRVDEVELTKNTAATHMLAMALRRVVTDAKLPKAAANTWCRFSVVLPAAP